MRLFAIAALSAVAITPVIGQAPSAPIDLSPIVQVGVFSVRPDGSVGGFAYESGKAAGEEFTAGVSADECTRWAGSGVNGPRSARRGRDGWELRGRVVSLSAEQAVVEVTWRRVREGGAEIDQPPQLTRLVLPLDQLTKLDTAGPGAPDSLSSCPPAVFGARYSSPFSVPAGRGGLELTGSVIDVVSSVAGATAVPPFNAELWLVHSVPGQPETVRLAVVRVVNGAAAFDFGSMPVPISTGTLTVRVTGQLRIAGSGARMLVFTATRAATFSPSSGVVRDGAASVPEGKASVSRLLPGPDDVLEFEMPPLAVKGLANLKDTFSVRLRVRPAN